MQARRITVLALLAGLALAGCGEDDPQPKVEPPGSSTPTPSPDTTTAPVLSDASRKGGEGFVSHWMNVFSQAQLTGDTSALRAISAPECENCQTYITNVEEFHAKGGEVLTDKGWKVVQAAEVKRRGDWRMIGARVHIAPQRVRKTPEASVTRNREQFIAYQAEIRRKRGSWVMDQLWVVP